MLCKAVTVLGVVLAAHVLAGCVSANPASGSGTSVIAALYPFAAAAERVAGSHAAVSNLTTPGAEPHDLELTAEQVAEVSAADLIVYQEGFQPALDDAVGEYAEGTLVEVTEGATPAGGEDPHIWLDPTKLAAVARSISDALARIDPGHADAFRRNTSALVDDLQALDREFRSGLARCERRTIVTSHAAFGHLARRYDLDMVPITGLSPGTEPSPARLAELTDVVTETGVTTIFSETLASRAPAQTLATEVGLRTAVLDPIEGLSDATSDEDYFSLMRSNLAALQRANGCQ